MRIIARPKLIAFSKRFPDSKSQLDVWWAEAHRAKWKTPAEVKAQYRNASILKGGRVVFNICGNKYRLIVRFDYEKGIGFVRFLGTHEEYDQIDAEEV
ncbi:addiction module toxin RelE [Thioclava sp. SK-1]|uniref:type II toxin-antitoxin system HigB family toxin n=1 Tax=Thioclava sp. SK-1 TaxID=1889770 RepID=UPI00082644C5|nr:type II toxin-antitoxin system HigB family toxin [Thioclava sp. SK-1]OCX59864.1 addiction module toxin RelE [Thioclava sp. SK-1]